MNTWRMVWRRRRLEHGQPALRDLMDLDGYDTLGSLREEDWVRYIDTLVERLKIQPGMSIYEVGCGAGALLFPLYTKGHPVAGVDYAGNLIEIAKQVMPNAAFTAGDALTIESASVHDVVLSQGAFCYFPDLHYAARCLRAMVDKARYAAAVLDVPDLASHERALELRRGRLGQAEYEARYRGLDHQYYSRGWFEEALENLPARVEVADQCIAGYLHNEYRFNVFIEKIAR
ncbi:MAG TPA: class I SAM-dependent methyltransferase [Bryobacteraceae bacterium]|nr:class I SAM-dependent methyltransferase [Bryobacteraceae bacterium]